MTIFDEYKTYTGEVSISPSLLWEYDLSCLKKEELKCYTRKLLRDRLLNS